jgi:hypothetical protein
MAAARPTRRLLQFSITSMLLVTALVAVCLAWELAFIRERQAWIKENPALLEPGPSSQPVVVHVPWWRTLLGDKAVPRITFPDNWSDDDRAHVALLFPEAELLKQVSSRTGNLTFTYTIPNDSAQPAAPKKTPSTPVYGPPEPPRP